MKLLRKYLLIKYSENFFPIFLTLFTITSIIFLVKIASLTSIIQINFLELLELFLYSVPKILFYTMPISVFVALVLTLGKLSSEYELIVITSFGLNPLKTLKLLLPTLLLSTIVLLLLSLALVPKADYMRAAFLKHKQTEAQFNIKASEYGQAFDKWLLYVSDEKDGQYSDIVLFQQDNGKDTFIISKKATMENQGAFLSLKLESGKAINITDTLNQVDFETMTINNKIKISSNINTLDDLIFYWKDIFTDNSKGSDFSFAVLSSFFPLLSLFFVIAIGYYNPRYDKNHSTLFALGLTTLFIVIAHRASKEIGIVSLSFIPLIWIMISYFFYHFKVKLHY